MCKIFLIFFFIILLLIIKLKHKEKINENFTNFIKNKKITDNFNVYIMHYTPLNERKEKMINQLNNFNFNYKFIESCDREKLSAEEKRRFNLSKLKMAEVSLFNKMIYSLNLILKSNKKYNLVLEDDAIFSKNFMEILNNGLTQLPNDYDMLFLGHGLGLHVPKDLQKKNKYIYLKKNVENEWKNHVFKNKEENNVINQGGNGSTRGCDSILISKKCAKKILNFYNSLNKNEINLPLDFWLNKVNKDMNLKIYWLEPTIVSQGSLSIFNSSLR